MAVARRSAFAIPAELVEFILLGPEEDHRQLQDSPILGDVWLEYAKDPGNTRDLLITPHRRVTAARVASEILARLKRAEHSGRARANLAYLQGIVAARLNFEDVLRVLVPLTEWWDKR